MGVRDAAPPARGPRILIYSHDSFGLGHLRRCRTIAHALVAEHPGLSVLILSGSPLIGSFDFRARVDFVRIPGVIKRRNGDYQSLNHLIDIDETLHMRSSIIQHTAAIFDPDLFIVDKEPLGLRGEVRETLELMKARGTPAVLGLRDVLDDPAALAAEWARKDAVPALRDLYDELWVFGLPEICEPLAGIELPDTVRNKLRYTGYLRRTLSAGGPNSAASDLPDRDFILVTTGGGGDGAAVLDWVLRAYEGDRRLPHPALLVFGPFLSPGERVALEERVAALPDVWSITFDANLERLMDRAIGVVAMGGYNTFCEILSLDKRAVIVPRTEPRIEQLMRARRARALGLVGLLEDGEPRDPEVMAETLRRLPDLPRPSERFPPGLLDGLDEVNRRVDRYLSAGRGAALPGPRIAAGGSSG